MPFKMNFAANLSTMFKQKDMLERFREAKKLGFEAVEAQSLYHVPLRYLIAAKQETGLEVALINSPSCGDVDYYDGQALGLACIPGQEIQFQKSVLKSVEYATALGCKKVHILAGLKKLDIDEEDLYQTYKRNLEYAAECLEEHNMEALIEPICFHVKEMYFMDTFPKAVRVISEVGSSNLKLLLDIFHLYMLERNVTDGIKKYLKYAGHVQISQAPGRQEPFYKGKINYEEVFEQLKELRYTGHIGLEYTPSNSKQGLCWLENYKIA